MLMGRDEKTNLREPKNMKAGEKGNLSAGGRGRKGGREGHGCGRTNLDSVTTAMVHCGDFLLSLVVIQTSTTDQVTAHHARAVFFGTLLVDSRCYKTDSLASGRSKCYASVHLAVWLYALCRC